MRTARKVGMVVEEKLEEWRVSGGSVDCGEEGYGDDTCWAREKVVADERAFGVGEDGASIRCCSRIPSAQAAVIMANRDRRGRWSNLEKTGAG